MRFGSQIKLHANAVLHEIVCTRRGMLLFESYGDAQLSTRELVFSCPQRRQLRSDVPLQSGALLQSEFVKNNKLFSSLTVRLPLCRVRHCCCTRFLVGGSSHSGSTHAQGND